MLSRAETRKKKGENSETGKLLNDIDTINKTLNSGSKLSTISSRSKSVGKAPLHESRSKLKEVKKDSEEKENKKSSIWSWKGLKSLTHIRNRKFNCSFSLQVHCIENLPPFFDDLSLIVYWKRRDEELTTQSVTVIEGVAEFEEYLTHTCSVYGSRSGPHHSAKYEAKHFLLYASVYGTPELDLGKNRMDLTRILPLTLEELEAEKSSGIWTTNFKLTGKAKGAILNVSFGYRVIESNNNGASSISKDGFEVRNLRQNSENAARFFGNFDSSFQGRKIRRAGSLPSRSSSSTQSIEDIKDLHEILPLSSSELSDSVDILYQKLDLGKSDVSVNNEPEIEVNKPEIEVNKPDIEVNKPEIEVNNPEIEVFNPEIEVFDPEIEVNNPESEVFNPEIEANKPEIEVNKPEIEVNKPEIEVNKPEIEALTEPLKNDEDECDNGEFSVTEQGIESSEKEEVKSEEETIDSSHDSKAECDETDEAQVGPTLEVSDCNSSTNDVCARELLLKDLDLALNSFTDSTENDKLDEVYDESVANEFLDMLGLDQSPLGLGLTSESEPEPESPRERLLRQFEKESNGFSLLDFGLELEDDDSSVIEAFDEMLNRENEPLKNKSRAYEIEGIETEALMREYGLNEKTFQNSPPNSQNLIDIIPENEILLPPLGEGLGSFIQTENGGFLRSMNPSLFTNSKNEGSLIMQVSSPVVVPAEMGKGIMDILQHLGSLGIEKLSVQANKLMPLEDITGMTMQQIAWDASTDTLEGPERKDDDKDYEEKKVKGKKSKKFDKKEREDSEYVSLEDLAPLAMEKIEALSIEGLKIQSGMSNEDEPLNINAKSIGECSAFEGKKGTGGLQLLDIKHESDEIDGLMGLSLTLDQWMKIDSGEINDEDEKTSRILAAHHAKKRNKSTRGGGILGNNFTVALMVQLRDPLRNYETVGTPMLALIQVERVFLPPKPKIYSSVYEARKTDEEEEEPETKPDTKSGPEPGPVEEEKEKVVSYKITEVHVAGIKSEVGKKKVWGSLNNQQQQSGSRWLLANGMGKKNNKHPLMKSSKVVTKGKDSVKDSVNATTKVQPGETLWSISSRVHGTGEKWKEIAKLNPHIRNPNVIFPNETIRLS